MTPRKRPTRPKQTPTNRPMASLSPRAFDAHYERLTGIRSADRQRAVCAECGSPNVNLSGYASWSVRLQQWLWQQHEPGHHGDDTGAWCAQCAESCTIDMVPVQ